MSVRYGPPDENFVPPSSLTDEELRPVIARVTGLLGKAASPTGAKCDDGQIARMCAAEGLPFVDVSFPPLSGSMSRAFEGIGPRILWKRPAQFLRPGEREELCTAGFDINGPQPGANSLRDGWLIAGMSILSQRRDEIVRMFARNTAMETGCGLYRVTLVHNGLWQQMVLDSFIPTVPPLSAAAASAREVSHHGASLRTPYFAGYNRVLRDLWCPLVEKAFAKKFGSYVSLQQTPTSDAIEALQDLTGYAAVRLDWRTNDSTLFAHIAKCVSVRGNIVFLSTAPEPSATTQIAPSFQSADLPTDSPTGTGRGDASLEASTDGGTASGVEAASHGDVSVVLSAASVRGGGVDGTGRTPAESIGLRNSFAYVVLCVVQSEGFRLCLVSNPSPNGRTEWLGAWSDKSELWTRHPRVRQACNQAMAAVTAATTTSPSGGGGAAGTLMWLEWRDVAFHFDGAAVLLARPWWTLDVRIPCTFYGTKPTCMLEVSVRQTTSLIISIHQRDRRGLEPTHADRTYGAFLITVLACSDSGVWDAVAQSHGGTFWRGRDVHLEMTVTPRDRAYYVLPRRYAADGAKEIVVSVRADVAEAVSVGLKQPTDDVLNAVRYSPVWRFEPMHCGVLPAAPTVQVNRTNSTVLSW